MVNFKSINKIHQKIMYRDTCNVYEFVATKSSNGATQTRKQKVAKYENIPCKLSFSERSWDTFRHTQNDVTPYIKQPKIFLSTDYALKSGDYFEVFRRDEDTKEIVQTYKGQGGFPQAHWTHQEVLLDVEGFN